MPYPISFLPPSASLATLYDRTKPSADQTAHEIPAVFKDAMTIREHVFVTEQGVPLENEFDDDDPRSFHWVVYASDETASNRVPVGTIRLVPPPHPPHPAPSDTHKLDNSSHAPATEPDATGAHVSKPCIKLGRLALLPEYRKLGLAAVLVRTALDWAAQNSSRVLSPPVVDTEGRTKDSESWDGLTLVHAQIQLERFWARFGFLKDEQMGVWDEEGIMHIGMWLTLEV